MWSMIKNSVASRTVNFKLEDIKQITEKECDKVTVDDWHKRCEYVT